MRGLLDYTKPIHWSRVYYKEKEPTVMGALVVYGGVPQVDSSDDIYVSLISVVYTVFKYEDITEEEWPPIDLRLSDVSRISQDVYLSLHSEFEG